MDNPPETEVNAIIQAIGDDTEIIEQCVLCGASRARPDKRFANILGLVQPYDVQRCGGCGLRWLSPRPSEAAYQRLYAYENYFDSSLTPATYEDVARGRAAYFSKRVKKIERFIGNNGPLDILDVGAATGMFVNEALIRGHRAAGIELSAGGREQARYNYGVELEGTRLEDLAGEDDFDVIHMNHVFEHLPDPRQVLENCRRLLRPGGLLLIEVPQQIDNDIERIKRLLGLKPPRFDLFSIHHTYFFNVHTLRALLESQDFRVASLSTANLNAAPLWPPNPYTWALRLLLAAADRIHNGGNILEAFALNQA